MTRPTVWVCPLLPWQLVAPLVSLHGHPGLRSFIDPLSFLHLYSPPFPGAPVLQGGPGGGGGARFNTALFAPPPADDSVPISIFSPTHSSPPRTARSPRPQLVAPPGGDATHAGGIATSPEASEVVLRAADARRAKSIASFHNKLRVCTAREARPCAREVGIFSMQAQTRPSTRPLLHPITSLNRPFPSLFRAPKLARTPHPPLQSHVNLH